MRTGIMQPYFLPYLGYWQLLAAVDRYVLLDDVNYIQRGWINRNRILTGGKAEFITLPLRGASQNKRINELRLFEKEKAFRKIERTVQLAYGRAPYYREAAALLEKIFSYGEDGLSGFLTFSIREVCRYLDISTELLLSSELDPDKKLKGQERILAFCEKLGTDEYWNAQGGQELYRREMFSERGMRLLFLRSGLPEYFQGGREFVPGLSILDILMFNSRETAVRMLKDYTLF